MPNRVICSERRDPLVVDAAGEALEHPPRGVARVQLMISDHHAGLKAAIESVIRRRRVAS